MNSKLFINRKPDPKLILMKKIKDAKKEIENANKRLTANQNLEEELKIIEEKIIQQKRFIERSNRNLIKS